MSNRQFTNNDELAGLIAEFSTQQGANNNDQNNQECEISIFAYDQNKTLQLYSIKIKCDVRKLRRYELVLLQNFKIQSQTEESIRLIQNNNLTKIFVGQSEIQQEKGKEFQKQLSDEMQNFQKLSSLLDIINPRRQFQRVCQRTRERIQRTIQEGQALQALNRRRRNAKIAKIKNTKKR